MMNIGAQVSIIVPVYNASKYLADCLNSLLKQTIKEIEVICIDDGSTDDSMDILDGFSSSDSRVKIISQQNKGAGAARNVGLHNATGEYVLFVDSDDYLECNSALNDMYRHASKYDLDVLSINHIEVDCEKRKLRKIKRKNNFVYSGKRYLFDHNGAGITVMPVDKLCKREYLNEVDFSYREGVIYEDNDAAVNLLYMARRVMHLNKAYYVYRRHERSVTRRKISAIHISSLISLINSLSDILNEYNNDKELKKYLDSVIYKHLSVLYTYICLSDEFDQYMVQYLHLKNKHFGDALPAFFMNNEEKYNKKVVVKKRNKYSQIHLYLVRKLRRIYYQN